MFAQSTLFTEVSEPRHDSGCKRLFRLPADVRVSAEFYGYGDCYRCKLIHTWDAAKPLALFLMMNPSGAGIEANDATVAKTGEMARAWGMGGQMIGNACDYRATISSRLLEVAEPCGPRNHAAILEMAAIAGRIVIAHGKLPGKLQVHADRICQMLREAGYPLYVLRLSQDGIPVHPLARGKGFVPKTIEPVLWK